MFSICLLAFIVVKAESCAEEESCPAANVLVEASITLELLPLIVPLEISKNRKLNRVQSDGDKGNRQKRRGDLVGLISQHLKEINIQEKICLEKSPERSFVVTVISSNTEKNSCLIKSLSFMSCV